MRVEILPITGMIARTVGKVDARVAGVVKLPQEPASLIGRHVYERTVAEVPLEKPGHHTDGRY